MSLRILKQDIKENLKNWIVCTILVCVLFAALYVAATSMKNQGSFMVKQFFTMFATIIPLIYVITSASHLVSIPIDEGSFFMVMVSGYRRLTIIMTKIVFHIVSILLMHVVLLVVSVIVVSTNAALVSVQDALLLNLFTFLVTFGVSSICFFASVFFNSRKNANLLGVGFPVVSYMLCTLANMFTNVPNMEDNLLVNFLNKLGYISIYSLFNYQYIIERNGMLILIGLLLGFGGLGIYAASAIVFKKKDICL